MEDKIIEAFRDFLLDYCKIRHEGFLTRSEKYPELFEDFQEMVPFVYYTDTDANYITMLINTYPQFYFTKYIPNNNVINKPINLKEKYIEIEKKITRKYKLNKLNYER